jgi:hypothetical protein
LSTKENESVGITYPSELALKEAQRQKDQMWANFTIERSKARAKCKTDEQRQAVDAVSNWIKFLYTSIWGIHFTRVAPPNPLELPPHSSANTSSPIELLKSRTRRLTGNFKSLELIFFDGDNLVTDEVEDLYTVHDSPVSFGGFTRRCHLLLVRDLGLKHTEIIQKFSSNGCVLPEKNLLGLPENWWLAANDQTEEWFTPDAMLEINKEFDKIPDFNYSRFADQQIPPGHPLLDPPKITWSISRQFDPLKPIVNEKWRSHLESLRESFRDLKKHVDMDVGCLMIESVCLPDNQIPQGAPESVLYRRALPRDIERSAHPENGGRAFRSGLSKPMYRRVGVDSKTEKIISTEILPGTSRWIHLWGSFDGLSKFSQLSENAWRCITSLPRNINETLWQNWITHDDWRLDSDHWIDAVYELSWQHHSPLLNAPRFYWSKNSTIAIEDLPFTTGEFGPSTDFPKDAWYSVIPDLVHSSIEAINVILSLEEAKASTDTISPNVAETNQRRFAIGLSFPGEYRNIISEVAISLSRRHKKARIFYDKFHEQELARPDLDTYLQEIYLQHCDLVVVFICEKYEEKEWCGIEWRAIRNLLKNRVEKQRIMYIRLDEGNVSGVFPTDGYIEARGKSSSQLSKDISIRLQQYHNKSQ